MYLVIVIVAVVPEAFLSHVRTRRLVPMRQEGNRWRHFLDVKGTATSSSPSPSVRILKHRDRSACACGRGEGFRYHCDGSDNAVYGMININLPNILYLITVVIALRKVGFVRISTEFSHAVMPEVEAM